MTSIWSMGLLSQREGSGVIPVNPLPGLIQGCLFHVRKIIKFQSCVPVDVTEGQVRLYSSNTDRPSECSDRLRLIRFCFKRYEILMLLVFSVETTCT